MVSDLFAVWCLKTVYIVPCGTYNTEHGWPVSHLWHRWKEDSHYPCFLGSITNFKPMQDDTVIINESKSFKFGFHLVWKEFLEQFYKIEMMQEKGREDECNRWRGLSSKGLVEPACCKEDRPPAETDKISQGMSSHSTRCKTDLCSAYSHAVTTAKQAGDTFHRVNSYPSGQLFFGHDLLAYNFWHIKPQTGR